MAMRSEENILDEQIGLSPESRACKREPPSDCEKYFYKKEKTKGST